MKKTVLTLLGLLVALAATPAQERSSEQEEKERLKKVLEMIKDKDPDLARKIVIALERGGEARLEAMDMLAKHAKYLRELEGADASTRDMLRAQERKEGEVRALLKRRKEARASGHGELAEIDAALRVHLEGWFDLRQDLRRLKAKHTHAEIEELEKRLMGLEEQPERAMKSWLRRIIDGGRDAMIKRMKERRLDENRHEIMLERLHELHPELAEEVMQAIRRKPDRREEIMERVLAKYPQIGGSQGHGGDLLHALLVRMHELLLPHVGDHGELAELTGDVKEKVGKGLETLVKLEARRASRKIEEVRRRIVEHGEVLAQRERMKPLIVEMKLAELTGRSKLLAW